MNLEAPLANERDKDASEHQSSMIGDFASGLGSHLKAPLAGVGQLISGDAYDTSIAQKAPLPQSRARMAGEMVGDAAVFLGTAALLRRVSFLGEMAPVAAGAVLGAIEPLKNGDHASQRLVHAGTGAATMLMIEKGPAFLAKTGLVESAEKTVGGTFLSGAIIGGATEQVNVYSRTGHLASVHDTATGAVSFGLTGAGLKGLSNLLSAKAQAYGEHSRAEDAASLLPSLPSLKSFIKQTTRPAEADQGWHLVLGSGGSKAALTGAGVVLATRAAKLKIESVGGVSGGFVPAALAATDMPSSKLLELARSTDIATLLTHRPLFKEVVRQGKKLDLLKDGLYSTEPLGDMLHGHMPNAQWPAKLWTMAVGGEHSEVVFTGRGVTEYGPTGQVILSSKPPKVSDAVRATSAIPGVLASMELYGRRLYDGALGKFGKCPSDMAKRHLGVSEDRIIASLPVGAMTTANRKLYQLAKYLSGNAEKGAEGFVEHAGIVIRPEVNSFHSLRFQLQPAQREEAILAGYRSALDQFANANLISGDVLYRARLAGESIEKLEDFFKPTPSFPFFTSDILRLTGPKTTKTPA